MSRPDRTASHQVPLQEIFDDRTHPRRRGNNAAPAEELPNERIEVRINLNQRYVPPELVNELRDNDMNVTHIIIISGFPPAHDFGNRVLQIVRQHAPNAVFA